MTRSLPAIRTLTDGELKELFQLAGWVKAELSAGRSLPRPDQTRTVGLLFFENSTRTRVAFEQAAGLLGHRVVNFGSSGSSISKGETVKDTILTLRFAGLDALVVRHPSSGAPQMIARHFPGPVLNAGDGRHEHPTQALGDALTIQEAKGRIEGLRVAIVGDVLHSRVARSNAWMLSRLGARVRFVGPRTLMPSVTAKLPAKVYYDLRTGIEGADVVMCLRLQRERMEDGHVGSVGEYARLYQISRQMLRHAAPEAIVMHPGPINRGVELDDAVADGGQSVILEQVKNGIYAKTAALAWSIGDLAGRAQA